MTGVPLAPLPPPAHPPLNEPPTIHEFAAADGDDESELEDLPAANTAAELGVLEDLRMPLLDGPVFGRQSWLAIGGALVPNEELLRVSNDDLQEAALRGDLGLVRRLIHAGASVNAPMRPEADDEFLTMLHILASKPEMPNGTRIIAEIIMSRANLNARSSTGSTPLIFACHHKHIGAIEVLLDRKAQLYPINDYGRTAATCAVQWAKGKVREETIVVEVIHLLSRAGADLNDGGDVPPMTEAVKLSNASAVSALVELGATPAGLHEAVDFGPINIIKALLKAVANPFLKDGHGNTVMDIALARGDEEIKTLLRDFIGDLQRQQHSHCQTMYQSNEGDHKDDALNRASCASSGARKGNSGMTREKSHSAWYMKYLRRLSHWCRKLIRHRAYAGVMFSNLLVALFLPDAWVIFDIPSDTVLDVLLLIILSLFVIEFGVQVVGLWRSYTNSFLFWMDLMGILSVPLDLSWILDLLPQGGSVSDGVVMRAARMAKLATRAGRFTKLVKLLRFLPGMSPQSSADNTARVISNRLNTALSIRVSGLILIMVMITPIFEIFTYPGTDYSMLMWMDVIGDACANIPQDVNLLIDEFVAFYSEKDYYPYEFSCHNSAGNEQTYQLPKKAPARTRNKLDVKDDKTNAKAKFNFTAAYRVDSICNCALIITIILLMTGSALILSNSVSGIVLAPLENLMGGVKKMANNIFKTVVNMAGKLNKDGEEPSEDDEDADGAFGTETQLLERVLKKLSALSEITVKKSPIDEETLAHMGEDDRAVLQGYSSQPATSLFGEKALNTQKTAPLDSKGADALADTVEKFIFEAGMQWHDLHHWDFDVLHLSDRQLQAVCLCLLLMERGVTENGVVRDLTATYSSFIEATIKGYNPIHVVPYHNWYHGVDVCWMMFRMMHLASVEHFLSTHERFALIASAMCHDIGHGGVNNVFLVETANELAIRYNDHSPLENMHCATMFEIARQPGKNVFDQFDEAHMREVRAVCIEAILHTDYSCHFSSVKEIQMIYEMNAVLFDESNELFRTQQLEYPSKEVIDLFRTADAKKSVRAVFLHFCDVSNPTKPWKLCRRWAHMIIDEFFNQGDREKEHGLTVQPLNDREKVNRPYSQVGFIEFFVAPLVFSVAKLMPPIDVLSRQLLENLDVWVHEWVETSVPVPTEEEQAKVFERITKLVTKHHGTG